MPNTHVEDFIDYYTAMPMSPGYAMLVDGSWGCGKTHVIECSLNAAKEKREGFKFLHISLYGISSIEDVEARFFQELHPVLSSKSMVLGGKIAKGLLKGALKVDLDGDGSSDATASPTIPNIDISNYLTSTDGFVLVFDDLERCVLPLNEILGYINYFVEKDGYKVILVADEEKLKEKSSGSNVDSYENIKEKLIGKTLTVNADIDSAFNVFLPEIADGKDTIEKYKNLIKTIFKLSGYNNLRLLRRSILDFSRLYSVLDEKIRNHDQLIQAILIDHFVYSLEIGFGALEEKYLARFTSTVLMVKMAGDTASEEEKKVATLNSKYKDISIGAASLESDIWSSFLYRGILDKESINQCFLRSNYFYDDNTESWVRLWRLYDLEDEQFDYFYNDVKNKFDSKEYRKLPVIKHVIGLFIHCSNMRLIDWSVEDIVRSGKAYIDDVLDEDMVSDTEKSRKFFGETGSLGLGFIAVDTEEFKDFSEYVENATSAFIDTTLPKKAEELLQLMKSDSQRFWGDLYFNAGIKGKYAELGVLHQIDTAEFVDTLAELPSDSKKNVGYALKNRYENSFDCLKLVNEYPWLMEVVELLDAKIEEKSGKVSAMQLVHVRELASAGLESLKAVAVSEGK